MATLAEAIALHHAKSAGREVGAYCKNGHERALHERRYERKGMTPARRCLLCQQAVDHARRVAQREGRAAFVATADQHPDAVLWAEFCRTVEDRIAFMRGES